jgi:hypothetical protein
MTIRRRRHERMARSAIVGAFFAAIIADLVWELGLL